MPLKKAGRPPKGSSDNKETATSTRPRREAAPTTSTPVKTAEPSKKRGRPAKEAPAADEPPAKRGRPAGAASKASVTKDAAPVKAAGQRGRPRKAETSETKKPATSAKKAAPATGTRKRGRPAGAAKKAPAVPLKETGPPKKRGRPPKGGETTKIDTDDAAAADQLEDELNETADELVADGDIDVELEEEEALEEQEAHESKRRESTKKKSVAKKPATNVGKAEPELETTTSGKHFWLMKAEQVDRQETTKSGKTFNTKFTIDDLLAKKGPEAWDGVRNPLAAKNMRMMKKGDLAFFYASGGNSKLEPGIVGIMEVVTEYEPDVTTSDQDHYAYVEKESDRGRWCVVHVEFRKKLSKPVTLKTLKEEYNKQGGVLSNMELIRMGRLSVAKVTETEWDYIHQNLIEGFDTEIATFEDTKESLTGAESMQQAAVEDGSLAAELESKDMAEDFDDHQAAATAIPSSVERHSDPSNEVPADPPQRHAAPDATDPVM